MSSVAPSTPNLLSCSRGPRQRGITRSAALLMATHYGGLVVSKNKITKYVHIITIMCT